MGSQRENLFEAISELELLLITVISSRARSMVSTKLDEAKLWLTKCIFEDEE